MFTTNENSRRIPTFDFIVCWTEETNKPLQQETTRASRQLKSAPQNIPIFQIEFTLRVRETARELST
jgi:hypothetical protein